MCAAVLLAAALQAGASGQPRPDADRLIGVWGAEQIVAAMLQGELTIDARGGRTWQATIAGLHAPVKTAGDTVNVLFSGRLGEFRGRMGPDSATIRGHWIQPSTYDPYGQRYASPVELSRVAAGVWRGSVHPLTPRVSFYIAVSRAPGGSLSAFIRNPEANFLSGRTYAVELRGDSVLFQHPDVPEAGSYDRESDRLFVPLLFGHPPLAFTRRRGDAVGFYPRVTAGNSPYVYKPPLAAADGWTTGTLAEADMDVPAVEGFVQQILTAEPSPENPLNIQSLLIARHGKLVFEEYFYGFDGERTHDMRSASKTMTSLMVGIARDRGSRIGPETPVYPLFSDYPSFANWDDRKNLITVGDLLDMTSGLAIDDGDPSSPGAEWRLQRDHQDWYKFALDLPVVRNHGGDRGIYGSASTNLAGGAVRKATGTWLPEFFDESIARPLQIRRYEMNLMPDGEAYAGGGLYLRPRDQLKLGQLYLDGGVWNGRAVVSREWVEKSTVPRCTLAPRMEADTGHGYGYAWHFRKCTVGGRTLRYYWAGGNGGQLIIVIPDLDMVVGFTGGDYAQFRKYLRWEIEFLPRYILSAAMR